MHVLMVAQSNFNYDPRVKRFAAVLLNKKIKVDVICLRYNKQLPVEEVDGVRVFRLMKSFSQETIFSYVFGSLLFLIKAMIKSTALALKGQYAFVHVHNMPDYLVFSALFFKLKGVPIILDIHDLTVELFKEKWAEKKFNRFQFILKFVEKLSCNFADKIITVSDECGERLIQRGLSKKKLNIIMNVADSNLFRFDSERKFFKIEKDLHLFYHGTIAQRYGLHHTFLALQEVVKKIPGTIFHIIGKIDAQYAVYLSDLAKKLNISANISIENPIEYELVNERLKCADLAIITESIYEYSHLGIPTKAFEYAAAGLPFIINDLQIVRNVFRNTSVALIDHNDSKKISETIIDLCFNPDKRKKMAKDAYFDQQLVSSEVMNTRYINLIQNLK